MASQIESPAEFNQYLHNLLSTYEGHAMTAKELGLLFQALAQANKVLLEVSGERFVLSCSQAIYDPDSRRVMLELCEEVVDEEETSDDGGC